MRSCAEINPDRWEMATFIEIRYCYQVGDHYFGVPPDQSLASGSVVTSAGKPGNGVRSQTEQVCRPRY